MDVMLTIMIILLVITIAGIGGGAFKIGRSIGPRKVPPALERPAKPSRDQQTLNERWVMEQEHELYPDSPNLRHVNCRVCGPGPLKRWEVPSIYDHVFRGGVTYTDDYGLSYAGQGVVSSPGQADVVTSQIEGTKYHSFMVDVDIPARLIPSTTPGCSHLYIDTPMTWRQYRRALRALAAAGVVEEGFYKASKRRGATHLRVPWKDKE